MKAPFPYFGGKSKVADQVWAAFGDVDNYIEPFAGSLAVLLARPETHDCKAETVNDACGYICNFWRALAAAPDEVAKWCDWPVNENDLHARHIWLVNEGRLRIDRLEGDPDYFDAKVAGWWVWGINAWIAGHWCTGSGPWGSVDGLITNLRTDGNAGRGVNRQLPHLGDAGQGVNRQLPHLGDAGQGVNRQLPHLGDAGRGVNRQRPHLGDAGQGVNRKLPHLGDGNCNSKKMQTENLMGYFNELANRLRRVRVCCGDWKRIVTNGAMSYGDSVGVFLDPPYLGDVRTSDLYRCDDHSIANEVREWCIANGENPRLKIILAGYHDEHAAKMPKGWFMESYSASKAYGTTAAVGKGKGNDVNRHQERLWYSPHCVEHGLFHQQTA